MYIKKFGQFCNHISTATSIVARRNCVNHKPLFVAYAPEFYCELPPGHSFPMKKYPELYNILKKESILASDTQIIPKEISYEDLALAHTTEYLNKFKNNTLTPLDIRTIGIPLSPQMLKRWRMTVQGTIDAAFSALMYGISGGYHHSFADSGHGYCAFNDIAIAIRKLQREQWISDSALVVDLDTHQGDGTAKILEKDEKVVTFSMHSAKNFPLRKMTSTIDVNLPDQCGDEMYLRLLNENLDKSLELCRKQSNGKNPGIVFYLAGVDVVKGDKLGRLGISRECLKVREKTVLEYFYLHHKVPIVLLTGGGYQKSTEFTAELHADVFREGYKLYNKV